MHRAPETVSLKNGKTAVFRAAEPDDAPEMIAFLKDTAGETPFPLRQSMPRATKPCFR